MTAALRLRTDLDHTLWDGNVEDFGEARVVAPGEALIPATGRTLRLFSEVAGIFALLREHKVPIAIASASPAAQTARRLLRAFGLAHQHAHVAPGKKDVHLRSIAAALRVP